MGGPEVRILCTPVGEKRFVPFEVLKNQLEPVLNYSQSQ